MSVINVDAARLERESAPILQLAKALRGYNSAVSGISLNLSMNILAQKRLDLLLKQASNQILSEAARMETLSSALSQIARRYKETEARLTQLCTAEKSNAVSASEGNAAQTWLDSVLNNIRLWFLEVGIGKAKKQERLEGEPVTSFQEREMDLYMQQEINKVLKDSRYSEKNWKKAGLDERKEILQEYISQISGIMGLPAVTIQWDYAESENGYATMGYFSSRENSININEWVLDQGDSNGFPSYHLMSTVVHEMRHYYQHEAINHPEQFVVSEDTLQAWEDSFNNYKSTGDFMKEGMSQQQAHQAYQNQAVEKDARKFAKQS